MRKTAHKEPEAEVKPVMTLKSEVETTPVEQLAQVAVEPPVAAAPPPVSPEVVAPVVVESIDKRPGFPVVLITVAFVLGVGVGLGFSMVVKIPAKTGKPAVTSASPAPTKTPEVTAAPTAAPVLRQDIKLQVLNGSGTAGKAKAAKEYLEGLGYADVQTGNADSDSYTQTEIKVKASVKTYADAVRIDLESKYKVASGLSYLAEDSKYDVVVIVGQE